MTDTVAIIGGTGKLGRGLALRWAGAEAEVVIGSRDPQRARSTVRWIEQQLRRPGKIKVLDNAEAAAVAGFIVLAVPFAAQAATLKQIAATLRPGAVLLDTTVPLSVAVGGAATRTVTPWQGSAAQQARELVPDAVAVVAAFHTVAAEHLTDWPGDVHGDVLVAGDDTHAKRAAAAWIQKIPQLRSIDVGALEMARFTEQLTALLISINKVHHAHGTGVRIVGLPDDVTAGA